MGRKEWILWERTRKIERKVRGKGFRGMKGKRAKVF